jgi:hypothetical protein
VAWLACCLAISGTPDAAAMPSVVEAARPAIAPQIATGAIKLAQAAQPQPAPTPAPAAAPADQPATDDPIGNVATLTGSATVTRNNASTPLKLKDDVFLNDILQTSANSTLGVTFNDATTFNLTANARITVDSFVYEDGGKRNAALFNVAKGTVAFVAAAVAKTGDMTISTPTATLGIRGTTGLIEVPEGAAGGAANNVAIKLYPDADGKVGRIEINDRAGARLGFLTQGSSGFTIRPTLGGGRFAAVPLMITPQQAIRDQGFVRQVHAAQNFGRQIVTQRQIQRAQNPGRNNPNRATPGRQPGPQRQNGLPGQQNRSGRPPGLQNGTGLQQPGAPPQPGQPAQPGQQVSSGHPARPDCSGRPDKSGLACRAGRPPPHRGKSLHRSNDSVIRKALCAAIVLSATSATKQFSVRRNHFALSKQTSRNRGPVLISLTTCRKGTLSWRSKQTETGDYHDQFVEGEYTPCRRRSRCACHWRCCIFRFRRRRPAVTVSLHHDPAGTGRPPGAGPAAG